jgi:hypothetical protein
VHVGDENEDYQIIRVGEREIWRELAFWDNILRFNEIKDLLKQKYGTRFKSLTPTDGSWTFSPATTISSCELSAGHKVFILNGGA